MRWPTHGPSGRTNRPTRPTESSRPRRTVSSSPNERRMRAGLCMSTAASISGPTLSRAVTPSAQAAARRQGRQGARGRSAVAGSSAGSSRGHQRHQAHSHTATSAVSGTNPRWHCMAKVAGTAAHTSDRGRPRAASHASASAARNGSSGT